MCFVIRFAKPRRGLGFSLIELLVVITIVVTLAALLLPVLSMARTRSIRTGSASKLRQLGTSLQLYLGDNGDFLPPYTNDEPILATWDPNVTSDGLPTNSAFPGFLKDSLGVYLHNNAVWYCKTDPYAGQALQEGPINHMYTSYLYLALPERFDAYKNPWPWVFQSTELSPTSTTFSEVWWTDGKESVGYWPQRITQSVGLDGHAGIFHF